MTQGLAAGEPVRVTPVSVADGLGAPSVGRLALDVARRYLDGVVLVDDATILGGLRFALERSKQVLEPAGAAALAAVLTGAIPIRDGDRVCVILSGGNVATDRLADLLARARPDPRGGDRRGMTDGEAAIPVDQPRPPAPPDGPQRLVYDGAFVGPMLPPGLVPSGGAGPAPAPVSDAVLAIPLGTRQLVGQAFDLLTRSDSGLRSASFYIGLLLLVTVAPVVMLVGVGASLAEPLFEPFLDSSLNAPIVVTTCIAFLGYMTASTEARTLAVAVIGGRAEHRPLRLRESIAIARHRFWRVLGANLLVGLVTGFLANLVQVLFIFFMGNRAEINFGVSLVVGTLASAPFAYVVAGIVLGEVGVFEAVQRSFRLARTRTRLALVIALFGILSQFIVLFGVSIGGDVVIRVVDGAGIAESFPPALVIPLVAALVFAFGTLLFLVESITAAPAVFAFEALTHYTHGLETGRKEPVAGDGLWSPWMTPGSSSPPRSGSSRSWSASRVSRRSAARGADARGGRAAARPRRGPRRVPRTRPSAPPSRHG